MKKPIIYSMVTCTLAYILIAIPIFAFLATFGYGDDRGFSILVYLTLISSLRWWGDLYYLALPVPWLVSCCLLALLIFRFNGGSIRRKLFSGLSIFAYYFAVWILAIILFLIDGTGYDYIVLWPIFGFGFGYAAALIVEETLKLI